MRDVRVSLSTTPGALFDLVGYVQINASFTMSMPEIPWPSSFAALSRTLSEAFNVNFATQLGSIDCLLASSACYRTLNTMVFQLVERSLPSPHGGFKAQVAPATRRRASASSSKACLSFQLKSMPSPQELASIWRLRREDSLLFNHQICAVGFLLALPLGQLLARACLHADKQRALTDTATTFWLVLAMLAHAPLTNLLFGCLQCEWFDDIAVLKQVLT
jgi:hypothetical protein